MAKQRDWDRFTFEMSPEFRKQLDRLAEVNGQSAGECLRRIMADKFAQLQQQEERSV